MRRFFLAVQVGPDHVVAGIIHVIILKESNPPNALEPFVAQINAPGFSNTINITDGNSKEFTLPGVIIAGAPVNPTVRIEIDGFRYLPGGASPANATAISFQIVFKLIEIFRITIGSIPVTAAL